MLTVCVSSTDVDLTTCGAVMLEIFGATTTDQLATTGDLNRLSNLIRRASAWAETYVQRPLTLQTYAETLAAPGTAVLMTSRRPVRAVLRLFDSTATSEATSLGASEYRLEDAEAGFLGRDKGFAWTAEQSLSGGSFNLGLVGAYLPGRETRPWYVTYAAGYASIGGVATSSDNWTTAAPGGTTSTSRTLPQDVEQAVILKVREWWSHLSGVESERVGDLAVSYARAAAGELGPAETLLDPYRSAI